MGVRTTHVISQQHRGESYCNTLKGLNIIYITLLSAMDSHFTKANTVPVQIVNITKHI